MRALCGELVFEAEFYEIVDDSGTMQQIDITSADSYLNFSPDGNFSVQTNEFSHLGSKALHFSVYLIEHPNTQT